MKRLVSEILRITLKKRLMQAKPGLLLNIPLSLMSLISCPDSPLLRRVASFSASVACGDREYSFLDEKLHP